MTRDGLDRDDGLDAALEGVARPAPPPGHLEGVLATTGPLTAPRAEPALPALLRPRWALPVAASVLMIGGLTWHATGSGSGVQLPPARLDAAVAPWGGPADVDRPVLPPEMYWAMDPFAEFATLRPPPRTGSQTIGDASGRLRTPAPVGGTVGTGSVFAGGLLLPGEPVLPRLLDDEQVLPPRPSDLPEIRLATIMPAPVVMPPLPQPAVIVLAEITLAPITLAPIDGLALPQEENP